MTTTMSRRSILARASVGAAAAALPVAVGTARACEDQIFAAINLNRKAMIECVEARKRLRQHRGKIELSGLLIGDYPDDRDTKPERPLVAYDKWDLEAFACGLPEPEREAWVETKLDDLRALSEQQMAEHAKTPRGMAWNAWNESCNVLASAMERLIETRPTTIAGVAAVLQHWLELAKADTGMEVLGDEEDTARFLEGLAEAAQSIG